MVVAATWEAEELAGEEYERAAQPSPAAPPAPVGEGPTDDELLPITPDQLIRIAKELDP
jgi:hypothetical protein